MRPNQNNKNRQRGRNNNGGRKHVNPLSRNFESNGPDVKVRGNAAHVAEKYLQLARDAQSSGDPVLGTPTTGNFGSLQSGALEASNVDLTNELVNMISAQRSYQANAQSIKAEDQVMQTTVNLA